MKKEKIVFNWSSGKDSAMALKMLLDSGRYDVACLLTTVSRPFRRVSQHGVRLDLLELQSGQLGIPLKIVWLPGDLTMKQYGSIMRGSLEELVREGVRTAAFGDIFLEELRQYRETKLKEMNLEALFPIWKHDTNDLADRFIEYGFKAKVVCVNSVYLDRSFAGREYDRSFLEDLPVGIDPCGENGEFHTFVYDGPLFIKPIQVGVGETVFRKTAEPDRGPDTSYHCEPRAVPGKRHGLWFCELNIR